MRVVFTLSLVGVLTGFVSATASAVPPIDAKLDQVIEHLRNLSLDALRAAFYQGVLQGALATAIALLFLFVLVDRK
jgi:hypothetical protein